MKSLHKHPFYILLVLMIFISITALMSACSGRDILDPIEKSLDIDTVDTSNFYVEYELNKGINDQNNPTVFSGEPVVLSSPTKIGFVFEGWFDSEAEDANRLEVISEIDSDIKVFARWSFDETYYDTLPVIVVSTNDTPILNKKDYVNASFEMFNTQDGYSDFLVEMKENYGDKDSVGIRLRGNFTMTLPKKPYRIKFDKKKSILGLESNKSWVLLADYLDPTSLRNYSAFSLADSAEGIDFVNSPNHVVLYLNGEYQGLYLLTEQVDEKSGRADVESKIKSTDTDFSFLLEMDSDALFEGVTGIDNFSFREVLDSELFWPIEIKYPELEDRGIGEGEVDFVFNYIYEYMYAVFYTLKNGGTVEVSFRDDPVSFEDLVDVDSFIDFYLVNEIMLNPDAGWRSVYLHKTKDGKLEFGPVWDFDLSSYDPKTPLYGTAVNVDLDAVEIVFIFKHSMFNYFLQDELNFNIVKSRYNMMSEKIIKLVDFLYDYQKVIRNVAVKDALFWYGDRGSDLVNVEFVKYRIFLYDRGRFLSRIFELDHEDFCKLINVELIEE